MPGDDVRDPFEITDASAKPSPAPRSAKRSSLRPRSVGDAGEFDFTLAISRTTQQVDFVVLTTLNGD